MGALEGMRRRIRALAHPRAADQELDDEIRFHIEQETEKNLRLGMSASEARRAALVAFGGVAQTREAHREARGVRWIEEFAADVRFALRMLRRNPALAITVVLTLALGVSANTAIFSAVNAVILRPLPFPHSERLLMLWEENAEKGWYKNVVAPANYLDWREQVGAFQDVAAYTDGLGQTTLTDDGAPELLSAAAVTGNFFSVLGVHAALGRTFTDNETWNTGTRIAVISDRLWRDQFGSDRSIIGRTIQLQGRGVQVVGVMPKGFAFPSVEVDVWLPVAWIPTNRTQMWFRRAHWLRAVARLRPGVSYDGANAQFQNVVRRLQREYPETNRGMGAGMTPLHEFLVGDTRLPLMVLLGAAGLLLLIACANVGSLLLVRAVRREREISLRLALGAGRFRLVRQALTESLVLSALGGGAGLALGWSGTRIMGALQPKGILPVRDVGMDWSVLGFVLAITTLSAILFGIAPTLWNRRRAPAEAIKDGGRGGSDGRRMRRWGDLLVIGEVALALLLTIGAGLLVRSFWRLRNVDPGFDPRGVLAVSLDLPLIRYDTTTKVIGFYDELRQRVRALPDVDGVAATSQLPLTGTAWTSDFAVAGRGSDEYGTEVAHRSITPEYFRVMHVPLLSGRAFTDADRAGSPPVVLINEALARKYFRGQNPVGQRLTFDKIPDSSSVWRTIVGVVGSEHQTTLALEPQIEIFTPFAQEPSSAMSLLVRTQGDPTSLGPAMRRLVRTVDPALAIASLQPMTDVRAASLAKQRFLTTLLLVFAATGLALAVVGVYGVLAQLAERRTREMGIRIALGARATDVRWLIVRHGLSLILVGLAAGLIAAVFTTRALRTLLYQVAPVDVVTFIAVAALLTLTGLIALWIPATEASRADPASVLRAE